jgi:hypothetical protein
MAAVVTAGITFGVGHLLGAATSWRPSTLLSSATAAVDRVCQMGVRIETGTPRLHVRVRFDP